MKKSKSVKAMIGAAVLSLAALTACGTSTKDIAGSYRTSVKLTDWMDEDDLAQMDSLAEYGMGFMSDLSLDMVLELTEDGSYNIKPEMSNMVSSMEQGFTDNIDDIFDSAMASQGVTEDQYEALAENAGYGSVDEFKDAMKDTILDGIKSSAEEYMSSIEAEYENIDISGEYKLKGDTITFLAINDDGSDGYGNIDESGSITLQNVESEGTSFDLTFTR